MEPRKPFVQSAYLKYSTMGFQMVVTMGLFTYAGYKLDQHFALKTPVCTIIFALVGVAIALYLVLKDFIKPPK